MRSVIRGLRQIAAMLIREAAHHENWTLRRAVELFVVPPLLLVTHLPLHARVRSVATLTDFQGVPARQPRFFYKYLNNLYLARGLGVTARGRAFAHHYHFLAAALDSAFLASLQEGRATIAAATLEGTRYEVTLSQAFEFFNEGELTLCLCADGDILYISSFTIVPGSVLKIDTDSALLVTRQQGSRGKFKAIAKATKDLMDLTPQFILFSALQGFAIALGIGFIACVSGARHISNADPASPVFRKAYDDFMVSQGAVGSSDDLFRLQVPVREKPLKYVKRDHRGRTIRKRRFRARIVHTVRDRLTHTLRPDFLAAKGA